MTAIFLDNFLSVTVSLIGAVNPATGLGAPLYLAIKDSGDLDGTTSYSSAADVAAALAGNDISAQAAVDLTAMFAQSSPPSIVYVATYTVATPETPSDALDKAVAAVLPFGVIVQESRTDTDNSLVGTWMSTRTWNYVAVLQSATAGLITSGKPSTLSAAEVESVVMLYGTATEPLAAGFAGLISGTSMLNQPLAMHARVKGVALTALTNAEHTLALANGVGVLEPLVRGSGSTERIISGTLTYGDQGFSGVATLVYLVSRITSAIQALVLAKAIKVEPIFATQNGEAEVEAAIVPILAELAAAGHFTPGQAGTAPNETYLPEGWGISMSSPGSTVVAAVTVLIGQEVTTISVPITAEVQ